jgi:lysozyme
MTARHQASAAALELIKRFEGYRRKAAGLTDGGWTIGYGHTRTAREGAQVSEADAEALLLYDVRPIAAAVSDWIYTPLNQNQFDALVAFVFNIGVENFRHSAVLRRINEGAMIEAACALEMWRKADFDGERIVVDALVRRRAAEKALFLTPSDGWMAAPSPFLRPRLDYDLGPALPGNSTGDTAQALRAQEAPASRAAAEAVTARLSTILPEDFDLTPTPDPPMADKAPGAEIDAVIFERETVAEATSPVPGAEPSHLAASAPGATISGPPMDEEPAIAEPEATAAPVQAESPDDPRYALPEQAGDLLFPSRRVVWREAPKATEPSHRQGGEGRMSFLVLGLLFVSGLALFASAVFVDLNTKDSAPIVWGLGVVGIVCVASSTYAALRRLGGKDD